MQWCAPIYVLLRWKFLILGSLVVSPLYAREPTGPATLPRASVNVYLGCPDITFTSSPNEFHSCGLNVRRNSVVTALCPLPIDPPLPPAPDEPYVLKTLPLLAVFICALCNSSSSYILERLSRHVVAISWSSTSPKSRMSPPKSSHLPSSKSCYLCSPISTCLCFPPSSSNFISSLTALRRLEQGRHYPKYVPSVASTLSCHHWKSFHSNCTSFSFYSHHVIDCPWFQVWSTSWPVLCSIFSHKNPQLTIHNPPVEYPHIWYIKKGLEVI